MWTIHSINSDRHSYYRKCCLLYLKEMQHWMHDYQFASHQRLHYLTQYIGCMFWNSPIYWTHQYIKCQKSIYWMEAIFETILVGDCWSIQSRTLNDSFWYCNIFIGKNWKKRGAATEPLERARQTDRRAISKSGHLVFTSAQIFCSKRSFNSVDAYFNYILKQSTRFFQISTWLLKFHSDFE